jgi:hypothetical protein
MYIVYVKILNFDLEVSKGVQTFKPLTTKIYLTINYFEDGFYTICLIELQSIQLIM